jgi:hypothetical protein
MWPDLIGDDTVARRLREVIAESAPLLPLQTQLAFFLRKIGVALFQETVRSVPVTFLRDSGWQFGISPTPPSVC